MTDKTHLTAEGARKLAESKNPDTHVSEILEGVRRAAEAGEFKTKTYACGFGEGRMYGGKPDALQQAVLDKLHALGYYTEIRVEERQFVDIWLEVRWSTT